LTPYGKSADSVSAFVFSRFPYGEKVVWEPGQRNPQEIYNVNNNKQLSPYGTKFYFAGKNILAATVLVNDKYREITEVAKHYF
jgi:hypothetical protein